MNLFQLYRRDRFPAVLVAYEKHGTRYLAASTPEELEASALALVTSRWEQGWYVAPEPPRAPSFESVDAAPPEFQPEAQRLLDRYEESCRDYSVAIAEYEQARIAVEREQGRVAFALLLSRSSYEYERVELESLETPEPQLDRLALLAGRGTISIDPSRRGPSLQRVGEWLLEEYEKGVRGPKPDLPVNTRVTVLGFPETVVTVTEPAPSTNGLFWQVSVRDSSGRERLVHVSRCALAEEPGLYIS